MGNIWEAIKTHKWLAIGVGGAVIVGVIIYAVTHKSSSNSSSTTGQDLLATPASGPSGVLGDNSTAGGGGNGISPANPANPITGVSPVDGSNPTTTTPTPILSAIPTSFTPGPTNPAPPSTSITVPANEPSLPIGLSGVNYNPTPNTPNQISIPSAAGPTQIALPVGETINTPVTVPNVSAGNPTVPLSDLISTGSTNTLSSAYGNAQTAAVASESVDPGTQAALNALVQAQFAAAGGVPAKTTPVSAGSTKVISSTPAKTTVAATSTSSGKPVTTVVSTSPAAGHLGINPG